MKEDRVLLSVLLTFLLSFSLTSAVKVRIDDYVGDFSEGESLEVKVYLDGYIQNFYGFEFDLYWNDSVLECSGVRTHHDYYWPQSVKAGEGLGQGHYFVGYTSLGEAYTGWGKEIATLEFKVLSKGKSPLDLENVLLLNSTDHALGLMRVEVLDGNFDNTMLEGLRFPLSILEPLLRFLFRFSVGLKI